MVLATIMFSTASTLTKWQAGIYPLGAVSINFSAPLSAVAADSHLPSSASRG
jgi:hypothetical protein